MKDLIIGLLHRILGYQRYLKLFSILKIRTLVVDSRKSDFLFFNTLLSKDANVLVIGACTGITTIPLALKNPQRTVWAYEPLSSNYSILNLVLKYFKLVNVLTFNVGLGNKQEQREIILPVLNGVKKHGMAHVKDPSIVEYNEGVTEFISLDLLDNRTELKSIKIDAIKIVAENFEYPIFEGAKLLIEKNKPLIYCELWNNNRRNDVLTLIKSYSYTVFFRQGNSLVVYNGENYNGKNFFFKPM